MANPYLTPEQFNAQAYLAANPDVAADGVDPYTHYTNFGINETRNLGFNPDIPVNQYMSGQIQNPTLPTGTEFVPVAQTVQANELQQAPAILNPQAYQIAAPAPVVAGTIQQTQANASVVDPNAVLQNFNPNAGQTGVVTTQAVAPMQAEQGTVNTNSTVQGQLEKLLNFAPGQETPAWAKGAVTKAEEAMASRGLGASSLAGVAIAEAIQQSALPIAAQDAQTYFQMDMQNLSNRQQSSLQNTQMRQQNMLTDVSVKNAALQFNAANAQQTQQFVASLVSSIQDQNAARSTAISQFNASEANQISAQNVTNKLSADTFNAQQQVAIQEFNNNIASQRDQFNSQMQFAIDQSNVTWRRSVNTQNTASLNAANQANVQNKFNMSQVALNNTWQQWRDEASWAVSSAESELNRQYNLAAAANNRNFASDQQDSAQTAATLAQIGSFAMNLLSK